HDLVQRSSNRRLEVFLERAFVATEHDTLVGPVLVQRGDGPLETIAEDRVLDAFVADEEDPIAELRAGYGIAYGVQLLVFVRALLAGRPPEPGMRVGLEAQRLAEAAFAAAESGEEIDLVRFRTGAGSASARFD